MKSKTNTRNSESIERVTQPAALPADLQIEYRSPGSLKPYARNARTHSRKQVRQIADCITTFGFSVPVLIDKDDMILAGHGRIEAAKLLKLDRVPCVRLESMTSEQRKRAFILADNKVAANAGWDEDLLAEELKALSEAILDFDIETTGFSIAEIDGFIEGFEPEEPGDPRDDKLPALNENSGRCHIGDVWQLGRHRLICGDALDPRVIETLMSGEKARMIFSDPPFNVPVDGHIGGAGKTKHREFAMASGEMTSAEFTEFLTRAFANLADNSVDGSIHFLCMDWRHMTEMLAAGNAAYTELKNLIVWAKNNGGMGTFYRSRHELIFAFKHGDAPHINTFELGQHGRYRTNVWEHAGVNTFKAGRMDELTQHPTAKPVQMIADAIKDCSGRGDIVLDIFGGSGSTLIAAEKTGRRGFLCEIDPIYCDRIIRRWEKFAKDDAVQLRSGSEFKEAAE